MSYDEQLAEAAQLFHLAIQRDEIIAKLKKAKDNPNFWQPVLP